MTQMSLLMKQKQLLDIENRFGGCQEEGSCRRNRVGSSGKQIQVFP